MIRVLSNAWRSIQFGSLCILKWLLIKCKLFSTGYLRQKIPVILLLKLKQFLLAWCNLKISILLLSEPSHNGFCLNLSFHCMVLGGGQGRCKTDFAMIWWLDFTGSNLNRNRADSCQILFHLNQSGWDEQSVLDWCLSLLGIRIQMLQSKIINVSLETL